MGEIGFWVKLQVFYLIHGFDSEFLSPSFNLKLQYLEIQFYKLSKSELLPFSLTIYL